MDLSDPVHDSPLIYHPHQVGLFAMLEPIDHMSNLLESIHGCLLIEWSLCFSLRVNLDMGKLVYSWFMQNDKHIPDTVVRSTTIPEELGRISYLLSDKVNSLMSPRN